MHFARTVKNAFTLREVSEITGLNPAMLNFLIRNDYLRPTYREDHDLPSRQKRRARGNTRYCSYRDLMIAKTIQRLIDAGVQLTRVKEALVELRADKHWLVTSTGIPTERAIAWLITDGKQVYLQDQEGFLELLRKGRQRAFSFIVDMSSVRSDVKKAIRSSRVASLAAAKARGVKLGGANAQSELAAREAQARAEELRPLCTELAALSARKAAEELNRRGIATPARGKWHAVTVLRVRERLAPSNKSRS